MQFIDFKFGEDSGYIRFEEPEAAQKARAAAALAEEGGLVVKNFVATLDPVTGRQHHITLYFIEGLLDKFWLSFMTSCKIYSSI